MRARTRQSDPQVTLRNEALSNLHRPWFDRRFLPYGRNIAPRRTVWIVMARRKSTVELVAYTVAVAGPLALYLAHRGGEEVAEPLEMAGAPVEPVVARDVPVIPEAQQPAVAPLTPVSAVNGAELPFALVAVGGLLLEREVPRGWGKGPVGAGDRSEPEGWMEDYQYGEKPADLDVVPARYAALVGKRVDLYGQAGKVCDAEITGLVVAAEINGDAYYVFDDVTTDDEGKVTPSQGRALRRRIYDRADRWLLAELDSKSGDCSDALFGRGAALPAPAMLTPRQTSVARKVKDDFLAEAGKDLRASYEEYRGGVAEEDSATWPVWDRFVQDTYGRTVYVDGAGEKVLVYQVVGDTESTCGDGFGSAYATMTSLRAERPKVPEFNTWTAPAVLVDADGNGAFETIGGDYETTYYDDQGEYVGTAQRPFEGCPC